MSNLIHTPTQADLNALKLAGFTEPDPIKKGPPRLSLATEGRTKMGKTHFAIMTTPEPVAVITMDPGTAYVAQKAKSQGRKIYTTFIEHHKKEDQVTAKASWTKYRQAWRTILGMKFIRTMVVDPISESWELLQLAEFGKLKQNNKFAYGALNAEFSGLIDEVYYVRPDLNTIYIQKVKKLYVKGRKKDDDTDMGGDWDGKSYEPQGFKNLDYQVDLSIVHEFQKGKFAIRTKDSTATRFGGEFADLVFGQEECTFVDLALHIFKDDPVGSDPEYWGWKF